MAEREKVTDDVLTLETSPRLTVEFVLTLHDGVLAKVGVPKFSVHAVTLTPAPILIVPAVFVDPVTIDGVVPQLVTETGTTPKTS